MARKKKTKRDYVRNPKDYSKQKLDDTGLDEWQKEVYDYLGNIAIRAGRQVGKSFIMAKKAARFALENQKVKILISASSERQAVYLYEKIKYELRFLKDDVFAQNPTMRLMQLKNGSEIYCLPTGQTGDLIRGLTLDVWIPDEAAYINQQVYVAVTPMLWVSKKERGFGWIWALSTPFGKQGKFYDMFNDESFKNWHIKSTECDRIPKEELERWKKEFSRIEYAQEVLGEFIDEVSRLFTKEILDSCFNKKFPEFRKGKKILGVDVARYGGDENAFVRADFEGERIKVKCLGTTERKGIHETFRKICNFDENMKFNKIIIDEGGVGGGLTDFLIEKLKSKILGINNAQRSIDSEGKKKKIIKQDLYSNAIILMEAGKVEIEESDDLYLSLSTIQFAYEGETLRIFGRNSHLAEAFVRALWGYRAKGLNSFVHYF